MRDVSAGAEEDRWPAARFAPEARVVRMPEWRPLPDGAGEIRLERADAWRRIDAIYVAALESLQETGDFEPAYERALACADAALKPSHVRAYLRRFFWQLCKSGYLDIPFEQPPELFEGRYRRIRELGRGGIGIAHLCQDEREERLVVVKHAWGYLSHPQRADAGMRAEGRAIKAFEHPGIVRFHAEFERGGLYHLVREFADGEPLGDRVRREGVLDAATRRRLGAQIADLLAHVHERGYLFLDITPGNFVLRADGSPLVIDVGVCRPHEEGHAKLAGPVGSRGYAAHELIDERVASIRSDVFGFGCLYQFLLMGRTPGHRDLLDQREATLREAGASEQEIAIVRACCADAPADRAADMRAVKALLARRE